MTTLRVTRRTARLLRVLLCVYELRQEGDGTFHMPNVDLMENARISSGTFYPLMNRLEAHGWVESEWEIVPEGQNRPPRCFYHLTEHGITAARSAIREDDARRSLWRKIRKGFRK